MTYTRRTIERRLAENLQSMPAVFVSGPRQSGKSTLVRHLARTTDGRGYATFDDLRTYASATHDPEAFISGLTKPVIIDEVQLVPSTFRAIKRTIDDARATGKGAANGQFLLTGSANALVIHELADALVGRVAILMLYPFSACEVLGSGAPLVSCWFDKNNAPSARKTFELSIDELIHLATFPEISGSSRQATSTWLDGYLTAILQRDVKQIADVERTAELPTVLNVLAARAGGLLNDSECSRDAKLPMMTFRRYRALMERLYLLTTIPPWHRNIGKRFVKAPKLYFTDTALLCHQMGVSLENVQRNNLSLYGRILENFVASELIKQLSATSGAALFHFRTHAGHETDFVIEQRNGDVLGIEVKAASTISPSDFNGLKQLKAAAGPSFVRGIVLYSGSEVLPFGEDLYALPLQSLWEA